MAIAEINEIAEGDLSMYDAVNEKLGTEPPEGQLAHVAGAREGGGFWVLNVWESAEAADRFGDEKLRPAIAEVVGDDAPRPETTRFEVHRFETS